jgi:hypothetical protein
MAKFRVYGKVVATKYIGEFEADSKEQAEEMAWKATRLKYLSVISALERLKILKSLNWLSKRKEMKPNDPNTHSYEQLK